jgi:hypothetical protein
MIAHDRGHCASSAHLFNDLGQPSPARFRVFDAAHLLAGVYRETIRNTRSHRIYDESAGREILDSVVRRYVAASKGFGVAGMEDPRYSGHYSDGSSQAKMKRESGESPELPRSGKQVRTPN